jgi:predicted dehydrogenase
MMENRKLRYGMVGGGHGGFIGAAHRMAAQLDGQIELVAGCFSADAGKSRQCGEDLMLASERVYSNYEEMVEHEAGRPADERLDFVSIVTPNHLHEPVATAFLANGFHVVCDKPLARTLDEAVALREAVRRSGRIFALTHNYPGYPMVKEAREIVRRGELGTIIKLVTEYPQGWLLDNIEASGQKQATWRTDPARGGSSCCIADIGTHAEHLGRYIAGLEIEAICAEFTTFVAGRPLEDDGNLLVRYKGGAKGVLYASQVSCGEENNLSIRIYGTNGALAWKQEHPNELVHHPKGECARILRRGNDYLSESAKKFTRLPFGHPEGYIEAFANVYLEVAAAIRDEIAGRPRADHDFPTIDDGVMGMAFIETAVQSAQSERKWTPFVAP